MVLIFRPLGTMSKFRVLVHSMDSMELLRPSIIDFASTVGANALLVQPGIGSFHIEITRFGEIN